MLALRDDTRLFHLNEFSLPEVSCQQVFDKELSANVLQQKAIHMVRPTLIKNTSKEGTEIAVMPVLSLRSLILLTGLLVWFVKPTRRFRFLQNLRRQVDCYRTEMRSQKVRWCPSTAFTLYSKVLLKLSEATN